MDINGGDKNRVFLHDLIKITEGTVSEGTIFMHINKYYILNSFRFYPRWRDWEMQQAMELDYTLDETQLAEDWASLLTLASQPGSSLEQLHIFVLAHVLRRPIIIYGVKYVKSWRGENLGYARFEGKTFSSNVLD